MRYLEKQKHIIIGRRTAEELKILIGTALPDGRDLTADVRGRSTETGFLSWLMLIPRRYVQLCRKQFIRFCVRLFLF